MARLAGVSRSIVSYVINNGPRSVCAETRNRVLEAIQKLDHRPNKHAQRLMHEKWDSVAADQLGVIISSVTMFKRPYYGEILAGIHEEAHRRHFHIRFIRLFEALRNPALLNQIVHKDEVSGLIFLALDQALHSGADQQLFRQIIAGVDRAVCLEWHHEGLPSVNFDRRRAAFEATTHLLSLGHRALAYIGPKDERVGGFRDALMEAELKPRLVAEADDVLLLVVDRASSHRSTRVAWPQGIQPLLLPAYSPQLNPAERCFQELRKALSNRLFGTLGALQVALTDALRPFWHDKPRLAQLTGYAWWLEALQKLRH